jgi:hypothetical protein
VTEETRKKTGKAKKKKPGKVKSIINLSIYFCTFCFGNTCRHEQGEGLGVKTPFHDIGEFVDNLSRPEFGPGSKGPST